jgi:DNA-binding NarL/FixJ family response regulator
MTTRTESGTELTDTELKVVRLVAMAWSDQRIAEELVVSIRTVQAHLRNAYAKTGATNRVQICNWLWGPSERPSGQGPQGRAWRRLSGGD